MHLVSWNVNGLRAMLEKGHLQQFLRWAEPDVLALQEVRAEPDQVDGGLAEEYPHRHWHPAERKGYSGTAILCREEPVRVIRGVGWPRLEGEGRVLTVELADRFITNVYAPNSRRDLSRLPFRQEWDGALAEFVWGLQASKPVLLCGDLNVAHRPIDLANPKRNARHHGFTSEERAGFERLLKLGFVDTFRAQHPEEPGHYSWWSFRPGARTRNVGWRIDYILASASLAELCQEAAIHKEIEGSDHCPVGVRLQTS